HRCTGVGRCRAETVTGDTVMCPSYQATRDEKDSTRGRARVLQEAVSGALPGGLRAPEVREVLDLCLACKGCLSDCPTGVDMATYKAEALHAAYRRRLRPASHYTLGWLPRWAALAGLAPGAANALLHAGPLTGLIKRLGGIDPRRELPYFAPKRFRRHRPPRSESRPGRPAEVPGRTAPGLTALLGGATFSHPLAPEIALAASEVRGGAGVAVAVPRAWLCCGLPWFAAGQLTTARRRLPRTVDALARHARGGMPIIALEPAS